MMGRYWDWRDRMTARLLRWQAPPDWGFVVFTCLILLLLVALMRYGPKDHGHYFFNRFGEVCADQSGPC